MNMIQHIRQEKPGVLIIGIGNELKMDDGAGLAVARLLAGHDLPGICILEDSGDTKRLVELWKMAPSVILIDAMSSGIDAGTVLQFDLLRDEVPARYFRSLMRTTGQSVGILEAIRLARPLGTLPERLRLFGIEGERFDSGVGLSPVVVSATHSVVPRILREAEKFAAVNLRACSS